MNAGRDLEPIRLMPAAEATSEVFRLLRSGEVAAAGALIVNVVLYGLVLLSINPANLGYSAVVILQNWGFVGAFLLAWGCPAVTWWGAHRVLRAARAGHWTEARRWLSPFIVLGFISWIVAGYYLLEARNLLNTRAGVGLSPPAVRSAP